MRFSEHLQRREVDRIITLLYKRFGMDPDVDGAILAEICTAIRESIPVQAVHLEQAIRFWSLSAQEYQAQVVCRNCGTISHKMISDDNGTTWALECGHTDEDQEVTNGES